MASITLRSIKGSPLTITEVDDNFSNLNIEVGTKLDAATYTAADVLTKLKTVDLDDSGLNASTLKGLVSASINTVSTIVSRDASGGFAAGTITATIVGNVTGNITGIASNSTSLNGISAASYALLASPALTGTPTAPTAAIGTNTTQLATTEYVRTAVVNATGALGTLSTQNANAVAITGGSIRTTMIEGVSPNSGSTGGIRIMDAVGNPNVAYLQATNNLGSVQYSSLLFNSNGTIQASGPISATSFIGNLTGNAAGLSTVLAVGSGGTGVTSVGASGNVLTSNGTAWVSSAIAGGFSNTQVFTATGSWIVPAGITKVLVYVVGGGGGGADYNNIAGNGGGAGGLSIKTVAGLSGGGTVTVTIGAGGTAGATGGTSSFGAYCSATGGTGGGSTWVGTNSGAGGLGSSGDLNAKGGAGYLNPNSNGGGNGGNSFYGGGGLGPYSNSSGSVTGTLGGGGAGGNSLTSSGAGGSGVVVVVY